MAIGSNFLVGFEAQDARNMVVVVHLVVARGGQKVVRKFGKTQNRINFEIHFEGL